MPPEVSPSPHCISLAQLQTPTLPKSHPNFPGCHNHFQKRKMEVGITRRRLIHIFVLILACMSIFRLVRIAMTTYSPTSNSVVPFLNTCNLEPSTCRNFTPVEQTSLKQPMVSSSNGTAITAKEFRFLARLVRRRAPCNLLIFGLEPEYILLSEINAAGTTIILEDNPDKVKKIGTRDTIARIYEVKYEKTAREAYKLLRHARKKHVCAPNSGPLEASACRLALTKLPKEVYRNKWDVILIDGPSSDGPEAPGRMAAIYSARLIAGAGNITNVVVHDVDRMIEKWFSWEFLCDENLVSSKGKFWNFRIMGSVSSNSSSFCTHQLSAQSRILQAF